MINVDSAGAVPAAGVLAWGGRRRRGVNYPTRRGSRGRKGCNTGNFRGRITYSSKSRGAHGSPCRSPAPGRLVNTWCGPGGRRRPSQHCRPPLSLGLKPPRSVNVERWRGEVHRRRVPRNLCKQAILASKEALGAALKVILGAKYRQSET